MRTAVILWVAIFSCVCGSDPPPFHPRTLPASLRAAASKPELVHGVSYKVGEKIVWTLKNVDPANSDIDWGLAETVAIETVVDSKANTVTAFLWAPEGSYKVDGDVIDWTGKARTRWRFTFVVGAPAPPAPPVPPPVPVDPEVSSLAASLKAALALDTDPAKSASLTALSAMYAASGPTVDDKSLTNFGGLLLAMQAKRKAVLADTAIPNVRRALAAYFNNRLPTADKPLVDSDRTLAKSIFAKAAAALQEAVK